MMTVQINLPELQLLHILSVAKYRMELTQDTNLHKTSQMLCSYKKQMCVLAENLDDYNPKNRYWDIVELSIFQFKITTE